MAERDTTKLPGMSTYAAFDTTLVAPGDTTNDENRVVSRFSCTFIYTIASIDTNVTMGIHVSTDGTNFGADPKSPDITHTVNDTHALTFTGASPYVALVFVAETGGTDAVITVNGAVIATRN